MSRSYKKPYETQEYGKPVRKFMKRAAAKAVRCYQGAIGNFSYYRKVFESYKISDWSSYKPADCGSYRK